MKYFMVARNNSNTLMLLQLLAEYDVTLNDLLCVSHPRTTEYGYKSYRLHNGGTGAVDSR